MSNAPRIYIIGDYHNDVFELVDNNGQKSSVESKPQSGGLAFVKKLIMSLCNVTNNNISEYVITCNNSEPDNNIPIGPLYNFKWKCGFFKDDKVVRCKEHPSIDKDINDGNNKKVYYIKNKLLSDINNDEHKGKDKYFLIESHEPINNNPGFIYKGILFDQSIREDLFIALNAQAKNEKLKPNENSFIPKFFWIFHRKIPSFILNKNLDYIDEKLIKDHSICFLNANTLRAHKVYIRRHVSLESVAQDYVRALYTNPILSQVADCRHLVTRIGLTAAIYSYRLGKTRWVHRLIFDPVAPKMGLFRVAKTDGDVIGYQAVFASCVMKEVIEYSSEERKNNTDSIEITEIICNGIRKAIKLNQQIFTPGFGQCQESFITHLDTYWENYNEKVHQLYSNINKRVADDILVGGDWLLVGHERIPVANPGWSIMVQSADYKLDDLAYKLVLKGVKKVFNNVLKLESPNPKWAPVISFGKKDELTVVDRREIESYNEIYALISRAVQEGTKKPLSIAVFGPPGSGKSFTVKKILETANPGKKDQSLFAIINLTKIKDPEELEEQIILECWKKYSSGQYPVIFFDEFDCKRGSDELGWLSAFLSPMEDLEAEEIIKKGFELKNNEDQTILKVKRAEMEAELVKINDDYTKLKEEIETEEKDTGSYNGSTKEYLEGKKRVIEKKGMTRKG